MNTIDSAREELVTFKKYGEAKLRRQKQLQSLTDLKIREDSGGIYVLVIGESETRDHMHIYGYERENTPFLDSLKSLSDAVIFSHAYSNHTHTVPCLTFALSERNQYNDINLVDAYSVVEVAKAAGYDTYWLSNQERFSPWDTPVAEIASVADRQVWLNGNVGKQINTFYYDGKLLDFIPDMSNMTNGFIIIHLMGNHLSYDDRYPEAFNKFSRGDKTIDTYDNSILYNDFVLRSIYEKVKNVPHFQGMIYLSDHGDDADKHLGHESSKFTYRMAHIPLIMLFSESFMQNRRELYETLKSHKDSYWTNDLLYNVMVNILGVQGIPNSEPVLDLGNEKYGGSADILMTLHGRKRISEDPSVKN
ncbi:MAG: phosphoethanolamine transferase [Dialister invisus]